MSHGFHDTPRASFFGAERNRMFTTEHHGASLVTTEYGPGSVPAYSEDSDIITCSFQESGPGGEGGIVSRRIPDEQDGKEWTSLKPTGGALGGAAWCPTNNKFYQGTGQHPSSSNQGMVAVFDPVADTCEILSGFSPVNSLATAGRAIWVATTGRVWVLAPIGTPKVFAIIDPADNSYTWVENTNLLGIVDMAQVGSDELWMSIVNGQRIWKINVSTLSASLVLNEALFEAWKGSGVTNWSVGAIEYVASIDEVWISVSYNEGFGTESWFLRLDSTGSILGYVSPSPGVYVQAPLRMYYAEPFDRLILGYGSSITSLNPTGYSLTAVSATDPITATKGCFCDSINKVALPVLTGPGGGRYYTVNFYSAADLGA
jgi:hypothetical protein